MVVATDPAATFLRSLDKRLHRAAGTALSVLAVRSELIAAGVDLRRVRAEATTPRLRQLVNASTALGELVHNLADLYLEPALPHLRFDFSHLIHDKQVNRVIIVSLKAEKRVRKKARAAKPRPTRAKRPPKKHP